MEIDGLKVEVKKSIPAGENPFLHDAYHMGYSLGSNVMVMFENHSDKPMKYFILVHIPSGKRYHIELPQE